MYKLVVIGCGGFIGAIARFGFSTVVSRYLGAAFPYGTFLVNVLGSFVIGALMGVISRQPSLAPEVQSFLIVGLVGSFTTFSTFGLESYNLLVAGQSRLAALNIGGSVVLGLIAISMGLAFSRVLSL